MMTVAVKFYLKKMEGGGVDFPQKRERVYKIVEGGCQERVTYDCCLSL